jgi:U2-associated protein SR140
LLDPEHYSPEGFDDDGYDDVYSTDNEEAKEAERAPRNRLCPLARKRFNAMLRAMVGKRGEVARCMAFCLEHGEAAIDVVNIVISSLLVDSTPVPKKIARLHLISDIIHNSAVGLPSAWKYREEFQSRLGLVFDHLSTIYHSFGGRMTAETFKRQVVAVIDVWDDRIVFPPDKTSVWKERLDGKAVYQEERVEVVQVQEKRQTTQQSKFKSAFKPIADADGEEDMELDDDDMAEEQDVGSKEQKTIEATNEDVDGDPMDDDIDGEVLDDDIDGRALDDDDIDGAPIDDVDGAPLDEDLDGDPVDLDGDPF